MAASPPSFYVRHGTVFKKPQDVHQYVHSGTATLETSATLETPTRIDFLTSRTESGIITELIQVFGDYPKCTGCAQNDYLVPMYVALAEKLTNAPVETLLVLFTLFRLFCLCHFSESAALKKLGNLMNGDHGVKLRKGGGRMYKFFKWARHTTTVAFQFICDHPHILTRIPWIDDECLAAWVVIRDMGDVQAALLRSMVNAMGEGTYVEADWKAEVVSAIMIPLNPMPSPTSTQDNTIDVAWASFNCGGVLTPAHLRRLVATTTTQVPGCNLVLALQEIHGMTKIELESIATKAVAGTGVPFAVYVEPGLEPAVPWGGGGKVVGGGCVCVLYLFIYF